MNTPFERAEGRILALWPDAIRIEGPDLCPSCDEESEYTFVLPSDDNRLLIQGELMQSAGAYCMACGFSNACHRPATLADREREHCE